MHRPPKSAFNSPQPHPGPLTAHLSAAAAAAGGGGAEGQLLLLPPDGGGADGGGSAFGAAGVEAERKTASFVLDKEQVLAPESLARPPARPPR